MKNPVLTKLREMAMSARILEKRLFSAHEQDDQIRKNAIHFSKIKKMQCFDTSIQVSG